MNRYFIVSIDTEADSSDHWLMRWPFQTKGVTIGVKERLTPLFQKYGVRPTYLLAHEILEDDNAMNVLLNTPDCELGTHLHWHDPKRFPYHDKMHRYFVQCHFSYDEEYEQMKYLTDLFWKKTGYSPLSVRAGRFGAGPNTGKILMDLGYKTDSSVTPHIKHVYPDAGSIADYTNSPEFPYRIQKDGDLFVPGDGSLWEIPVSIRMRKRYWDPFGLLSKKILFWFRPRYAENWQLLHFLLFAKKNGVINLMFHNVEVLPGLSPYTKSEEDVKRYLGTLSLIFSAARLLGYQFVTMSEYTEILHKEEMKKKK